MPDFAIHNGTEVVNVIVADSLEIAESVTGMEAIEVTTNGPGVGWVKDDNGWITTTPSPYPSWSWDYEQMTYVPPVPSPGDGYAWDEEAQEWQPMKHFGPED
jgi:hypothetical protein